MRRNELDYARGIAILLILIGHSNEMPSVVVKLIYSFHVPLFFFISGILICYTNAVDKTWKYIGNGWLKRLIIPVVIWEIILSAFYFVFKDIPLKQLVLNSITLNFNLRVLWFIPCLLAAEMICLTIWKSRKKEDSIWFNVIIAVVAILSAVFVPNLFFKRIFVATTFVVFGYSWEKIRNKNIQIVPLMICSGVIWFIAGLVNVRVDLSAGVFGNVVLYIIHSLFGSLTVILISEYLPKSLSLLMWIGRNTMGFLVTHVFVRHAIIAIEERVLGYFFGGWFLAVPMILIDIVVVWLISRIIPELFGIKRLKKGDKKYEK